MDTSLLVWSLRIRETEALYKSRQQEHAAQTARRQALQSKLQEREDEKGLVLRRVYRAQERCAQARRGILRDRADVRKLQAEADCGTKLSSLREARRDLAAQEGRLKAAVEAEAQHRAALESEVSEHIWRTLEEPLQGLEEALAKLEQRMSYARAKYDMAALDAKLREQREAREALEEQVRSKRARCEAADTEAEQLRGQIAERERRNVEAVEGSQAALREARSRLSSEVQQREREEQRLRDLRAQRMAAASLLAELQRAADAARRAVECVDSPGGPPPPPQQRQQQQQQPQQQPQQKPA